MSNYAQYFRTLGRPLSPETIVEVQRGIDDCSVYPVQFGEEGKQYVSLVCADVLEKVAGLMQG